MIGAFSIAGAVLENDLEMFRWLDPHEMIWSGDNLRDIAESYRENNSKGDIIEGQSDTEKRQRVPIYELEEFSAALSISRSVSPLDIEEVLVAAQNSQTTALEYVAHRLSDGSMYDCASLSSPVPIHLEGVFDYEVISFAKKYYFPGRLNPTDDIEDYRGDTGLWIAAIGAVNMLNPGGAVLSLHLPKADVLEVRIEFLGSGEYLLLTNLALPPTLTVVSAKSLHGEDSYDVDVTLHSRAENVMFQSESRLVYSIVADVTIRSKIPTEGKEESNGRHSSRSAMRESSDQGAAVVIRLQT